MNVMLVGCNGKMGKTLADIMDKRDDIKIACGLDIKILSTAAFPVYSDISAIPADMHIDAVIDFSHPAGVFKTVQYCEENKKPLVYATTGLDDKSVELLEKLSTSVPVFMSANMSLGVNLLIKMAKQAAVFLQNDFDIEIVEKHHSQKIDAPSGTALKIADEINASLDNKMHYVYERASKREKRSSNEIGLHSIRAGTITGEHDVIFAGKDESITISHQAFSKDIFAQGAIKAAFFIKDKKAGMYTMDDMIEGKL